MSTPILVHWFMSSIKSVYTALLKREGSVSVQCVITANQISKIVSDEVDYDAIKALHKRYKIILTIEPILDEWEKVDERSRNKEVE